MKRYHIKGKKKYCVKGWKKKYEAEREAINEKNKKRQRETKISDRQRAKEYYECYLIYKEFLERGITNL